MSKEFNARSEIMEFIAKTNDDTQRMVWMMMLGILEQQEEGFRKIEEKLDQALSNEESLRKSVLNGHSDTHHDDHDWVQERRKANCSEVCAWSRKKMEAEAQAEQDAKEIAKAGKKAAVEQVARMAVIGLIGAMSGVTAALMVLK